MMPARLRSNQGLPVGDCVAPGRRVPWSARPWPGVARAGWPPRQGLAGPAPMAQGPAGGRGPVALA